MKLKGITWEAGGSTDMALLGFLPEELREIIEPTGGVILHHGAIHFRGCTFTPGWNSLRPIYHGKQSLKTLYPAVGVDDVPFAQDQCGDQYLLRGVEVMHLAAETGEIARFAGCLTEFMDGIRADIEDYLNVSLSHRLQPGQGLHAHPPFCVKESAGGASSLKPVSIVELIQFHADLARQIADVSDGGTIEFQIVD
jgi:hypothetical protein